MIKVRQGVFETNSSSTHTITMCTEDKYNLWQQNKMFWDNCNDTLVTEVEMLQSIEAGYGESTIEELKEAKDRSYQEYLDALADYDFYTRRSFIDAHTYEHFSEKFTTPSGEVVYAFGWYGSDY